MAVNFTEKRPWMRSKNIQILYIPLIAQMLPMIDEINVTTSSEKGLLNLFTFDNLGRSRSCRMPRVWKPVKQMEGCPIPQIVTSRKTDLSICASCVMYSRVRKLSFRSVTVFTTRVSLRPWWILSIRTIRRDRPLYSRVERSAQIVKCIHGSHFSSVNINRVLRYNLIDRKNTVFNRFIKPRVIYLFRSDSNRQYSNFHQ